MLLFSRMATKLSNLNLWLDQILILSLLIVIRSDNRIAWCRMLIILSVRRLDVEILLTFTFLTCWAAYFVLGTNMLKVTFWLMAFRSSITFVSDTASHAVSSLYSRCMRPRSLDLQADLSTLDALNLHLASLGLNCFPLLAQLLDSCLLLFAFFFALSSSVCKSLLLE